MKTLKLLTAAIAITALCSCNGCPVPGWLKKVTHKQPPAVACPSAAKNTPANAGFCGVVAETLNTAGYTYASVVSGSDTLWAVAPTPAANVKKGDSVTFSADMPMENYLSKTLNRTFKLVYFTGAIQIKGNGALDQIKKTAMPGHGATTATTPGAIDFSGITKPQNGQTVEELYTRKNSLVGKKVFLRAKVVKANYQILNLTWLHLRDGSGRDGTNDITVTTKDSTAAVGNIVLIEGTLNKDKNLGQGYQYPLIIENATVRLEK